MIAYESSGAAKAYDGTTSVAIPSGVDEDDLVLITAFNDSSRTFTFPAGFTTVTTVSNGISRLAVAWKRATAAESGSYTITAEAVNFTAQAHRFSGALLSGDPVRDFATGTQNGNDPSASLASVPANDILISATSNSGTTAMTPPSGYTLRGDSVRAMTATKFQTTTGATGAVTPGTVGLARRTCTVLLSLVPEPAPTGGGLGNVIVSGERVPVTALSVIQGGARVPATGSVIQGGERQELV